MRATRDILLGNRGVIGCPAEAVLLLMSDARSGCTCRMSPGSSFARDRYMQEDKPSQPREAPLEVPRREPDERPLPRSPEEAPKPERKPEVRLPPSEGTPTGRPLEVPTRKPHDPEED